MANNFQQGIYEVRNPRKYVGKHRPKYRSGWELKFMRMCDSHPNILAWASESHRIPYRNPVTGKNTNYVPDFFIVYEDKEYKEVDAMSPRSRDASVNRFLTRLGTFLNNDVALTPMECLQRIYIMYDEEVNAK